MFRCFRVTPVVKFDVIAGNAKLNDWECVEIAETHLVWLFLCSFAFIIQEYAVLLC